MGRKSRYISAIGLEFEESRDAAPRVSLRGEEDMADEVVKLAYRFGVPVVDKPELVKALKKLDIEEEIPNTLYLPIAILMHELEKAFTKRVLISDPTIRTEK